MDIKIIKFVIIASGFISIEDKTLPCNNAYVALVDPQEGQGIPVIFLK